MLYYSPNRSLVAVTSQSEGSSIELAGSKFIRKGGYYFGRLGPQTLAALQAADIPVSVAPDYIWPGPFNPMQHQKEDIAFMLRHRRCAILDDMGVGKTAAALWAANILMTMNLASRVLVLCTKSCLQDVWGDSANNILMHRECEVADAVVRSRGPELIHGNRPGILVTNHDAVINEAFMNKLRTMWIPDIIIVDEASGFKSPSTLRSRRLLAHIKHTNPMVWLLTGTPCSNGPLDVIGLHKLLHPNSTMSQRRFKQQHMVRISPWKWVPRPTAMEEAYKLIEPNIRHTRDVCMTLPPMQYTFRRAEFSEEQTRAMQRMRIDFQAEVEDTPITAVNAAVKLGKMLQIACGSVMDSTGEPRRLEHNRNKLVAEIVDQAPSKVLVFAPYLASLYGCADYLKENGHRDAKVISGHTSNKDRQEHLDRFRLPSGPKVLLAHPQTMAHGLTLTEATTIIWYCPVLSLEQYQQANARIYRKGQKHKCLVVHIEGSEFEQALYKSLELEADMQEVVLKLAEQASGG